MAEPKVVISSTVLDLPEHRKGVLDACLRQGMFPLMMEHLPATPQGAISESLRLVKEATIYLGIFARRYGYVPEGHDVSITEMEYEKAGELELPRLVFLMHDEHLIRHSDVDIGEGGERIGRLRERLETEQVVGFFRSADDLRAQVIDALARHRRSNVASFHFVRDIPKPPEAYVAHPYTLLQTGDLVGRQAELNQLTDWVAQAGTEFYQARVLCLVAIGGMGKSAVTWKWFDEIVRHEMEPLAGRLWWSFYESDATYENFVTRALAYVRGVPRADIQRMPIAEREVDLLNVLDHEPFLVVLDGLERILLAYARPDAARLPEDHLDEETANFIVASGETIAAGRVRHRLRKAADPRAGNFLRKLSRLGQSRVLISTRLFPAELQTDIGSELPGVKTLSLTGLTDDDALDLWRAFGVGGARAELRRLFRSFDNYPLLIRALAGEVARFRRAPGHFDAWREAHPDFDPFALPLVQRKSHVLSFALRGIHRDARQVLMTLAAFRMPATYDNLVALLIGIGLVFSSEGRLDAALTDLEDRGLVGWDRRANRYDLHPVVRGVTWHGMGRIGQRIIFQKLETHFGAIPARRREARSLDELTAALELYNTLASLERYDEAYEIFRTYLYDPMCLRLSLCAQAAEYLEMLFPKGPDAAPALTSQDERLNAIWDLAYSFSFSGQVALAEKLWRRILDAPKSPWLISARASRVWHNLALSRRDSLRASEFASRKGVMLAQKVGGIEPGSKLTWLAELLSLRGKSGDASLVFEAAVASQFAKDEEHDVGCYTSFSEHALRMGAIDRAAELAEYARKLALSKKGLKRPAIDVANAQSAVLEARDEIEPALEQARFALVTARSMTYCTAEMRSLLLLARLRIKQQNLDGARGFLDDLWELTERGPYPQHRAHGLNLLANIEFQSGDKIAAAEAALEAYRLAWCEGPPFANAEQLSEAQKTLGAVGVAEPTDLPTCDESEHPPLPAIKIENRTI